MKITAYFDSGTTNTRLYLLNSQFHVIFSEKQQIGSKDSAIKGSNRKLILSMKKMYDHALGSCGLEDRNVAEIYASGMASSPYGLKEVPHLQVPIRISAFSDSLYRYFEETCFFRNIYLVPGLRTADPNFVYVNNMRGEEIEIIGALDDIKRQADGKAVVILPGSHTHAACVETGAIKGILSNFTGELFHALKTATILSPVLSLEEQELNKEMVQKGYQCLNKFGFNRAIYIVHAMRIFREGSEEERFSFAEGVINGGIRQSVEYYCENVWNDCNTVVLMGNAFMYQLYSYLFEGSCIISQVVFLPDSEERPYSVKGLEKLIRLRGENHGA